MATTATICRLKNVSKRLLKTKYTHLSPPEKRYIKLIEQETQLNRDLSVFWRLIKRDEHGKASQDNDWDFYHWAEAQLTKVIAQIERLLAKNGWDKTNTDSIKRNHTESNLSPGGSF
jgi:hypothetical protein